MKGYTLGFAALSAVALQADARAHTSGNAVTSARDTIVSTVKAVVGDRAEISESFIDEILSDGLRDGVIDQAYLERLASGEDRIDFEPTDRITLPEVLKKCPKLMSGNMAEMTCVAKDPITHKISGAAIVDLVNSGGALGGILNGMGNKYLAGMGMTFADVKQIINDLDWDLVEKLDLDHMLNLALGSDENAGKKQPCTTPKLPPKSAAHVVDRVHTFLRIKNEWLQTEDTRAASDEWTINRDGESGCIVDVDGSDLPLVVDGHLEPEWASNLDFEVAEIEWNDRKVGSGHHGFVTVFDRIKEVLIADINKVCGQPTDVTYSGHSRGGAIAEMLAIADYDRVQNLKEGKANNWNVHLVTWGAPRALTTATVEKFDGKFEQSRLMNRDDPVPGLIKQDFSHIGELYCLDCAFTGRDDANEPDPTQIPNHSGDVYWSKLNNATDPLYVYGDNKIAYTGDNCEIRV